MNDIGIDSPTEMKLAELDRRVQTLETKVAALPDAKDIESRIKASIPPSPPPIDPSQAPSFRDISLPMPNVQTLVATAKTTWTLFEMIGELQTLFWTLFDRRYHMAWITRFITITLLVLILTSHWWAPFAVYDNFVSHLWDKLIDLALCLILFMVLSFETRRYKEWRSKR
jgi:hypothetical protein